jgi:DNA repair exonuclease SbcCD ATPase subunit
MKITRLKLVNFIGIKHGTNLDEIEIDFGDKRIVMLNGGNGSGKSTILSQLHPFKDSFDERKSVIVEGKDGTKEIDIEHNGDVYEIVHYYGKKAQSFVKKNGTEMNENGGVKTFEAFIQSEFGLTNEYFKIGKIGSNTKNFIDQTAAERKTYIANFLPAIEDYQEKFEIVKEKFRVAQTDIKAVSADLQNLEQEESLKNKIETFEKLIDSFDKDIERYSGESAVLSSEIEKLNSEILIQDIATLTIDNSTKESKKKQIELFAVEFVNSYGKLSIEELEKFIKENEPVLNKSNEKLAVLLSEKSSINEGIIRAENEIKKSEYNLAEVIKGGDLKKINSELETVKKKLEEQKEYIKNPLFEMVNKNQKDISSQLYKFEYFKNFIVKYFNNLNERIITQTKSNVEFFMEEDFNKTLESQSDSLRSLIQGKQLALGATEGKLAQKELDYQKFQEVYKGKNIDDEETLIACAGCPLAQDILELKELPTKIEQMKREISQIKKDLENFEIKAEKLSDLSDMYKQFNSLYDQMNPRTNQVFVYFVNNHGSIVENVLNGLNDFKKNTETIINDINSILFVINEMSKIESDISNLYYKKNMAENNESIKKNVETAISEKKSELNQLKGKLSSTLKEIDDTSTKISKESKRLEDYKVHLEGRKERNNLVSLINANNEVIKLVSEKKSQLSTKGNQLSTVNYNLSDFKKRKNDTNLEMIKAKTSLINVETLKSKKVNLEKNYNDLRLLKDALDPNKGVPLYFIKAYLDKTKDIANELLELAFGGNFEIDFFTSDKEFFIKVRAGENIKNDIKEASQGEVALTTISISLALIEQAIGKYNILALDEIDGPLDYQNRTNFISILNTQIGKLGIEQVFVISHNDAFDTEEMDLILLNGNTASQKGDEFMRNKNIIYKLKD